MAIRIGLETVPVGFLLGIRYVISGSILLLAARFSGIAMLRGRELRLTALGGIVGIGIGSGFLMLAELYIPSGLAALFYTTAPFWTVGIDALLPHGRKPLLTTLAGLLVGVLGVAYLIFPAIMREGLNGKTMPGFLLIEISVACWVLGSLLQKRVHSQAPPFVSGAVQQLAAGMASFVPAFAFQKFPHFIGLRAITAVLYLVFFGSIIGYSAFIYSVKKLPVAIVSVYYFVNPIVAVFLGWLIFKEPFGLRGAI